MALILRRSCDNKRRRVKDCCATAQIGGPAVKFAILTGSRAYLSRRQNNSQRELNDDGGVRLFRKLYTSQEAV